MADKVVIITGGSRGIGRAAGVELAHRGCSVSLVARNAAGLEETARLCQRAGSRALVAAADVTDDTGLADVVALTVGQFGRIDGVVNNAGYAPQAGIEETDAGLFEKSVAINLTAAMTLSRLAWPHLRKQGGVIVNVSSMSAVDPLPGLAAYAAAKAGLLGLTRALAREGQQHGIRSVSLILGAVETEMFSGLHGAGSVPRQDLLTPQEVAVVIADCLTGPLAYSNGEHIYLRKRI
jgi:3-oxoacyl-[acyl-carrier protein] reductase